MSKIVQAVNAMISNPQKITAVTQGSDGEVFFLYNDKYKWSMTKDDNSAHILWFYPGDESLRGLSRREGPEWEGVSMVTYRDTDIGTKEAKASFRDLYSLLREKVFGVSEVLDDIIRDDIPF